MRRALLVIALVPASGLVLLVVMSSCEAQPLAGFGPTASYQVMRPWFPGCPFSRRVTRTTTVGVGSFWVSFPVSESWDPSEIGGDCDCRFRSEVVAWTGTSASVVEVWNTWPRADPVLRVVAGGHPMEVANTLLAAQPVAVERRMETTPWTMEIGGALYSLDETRVDGVPNVVLLGGWARDARPPARAVVRDARGNEFEWVIPSGEASQEPLFGSRRGAQGRIGRGRFLCRHAAWWELTVTPDGGEPVTARFPPPR